MRIFRLSIILLIMCSVSNVWADDAPQESVSSQTSSTQPSGASTWNTTEKVLLAEGLAVFNAGLASTNPRGFGSLVILTTPLALGGCDRCSWTENWVGAGTYASIGIYNVTRYRDDYSPSRVFRDNFVAWNLAFAVFLVTHHFAGNSVADKVADHLSITSQIHGGVRVAYRWSF